MTGYSDYSLTRNTFEFADETSVVTKNTIGVGVREQKHEVTSYLLEPI